MTTIQSFLKKILPKRMAQEMEAESREWVAKCSCGYARTIWDMGGVRWKASGNPRRMMKCPHCGQSSLHTVSRSFD